MECPVAPPAISVVTATYHRSAALRCAIESVRGQTRGDWEHWVVGDACTDDTGHVVESIGDPRVRWHNLPGNCGEQSGPNMEGTRRARGKYLAFLNHDDLWLPDHLELAVRALETSGADLVFALALQVESTGQKILHNWPPDLGYSPEMFIPASSWVFRRELFDRIGPWRPVRELRNFPSQEWLFRAWRSGASIRALPLVTSVFIPSRGRRDCYVGNQAAEQEAWLARIRSTPRLREELTVEALFGPAPRRDPVVPESLGIGERLLRARKHYVWKLRRGLAVRIARWTRGHPTEWEVRLGGGSATESISRLRKSRGLSPL